MSKEDKPEDLESTIRLDMRKIVSPYDDPTPTSADSIEDILSAEGFSDETLNISYDLPEETIISAEESINFDDLTKEMNELSNEFESDIEPQNKAPETPMAADKPIEKKVIKEKVSPKIDTAIKKEASPKISPPEAKPDEVKKPSTPSADKKEVADVKQDVVEKSDTPSTNKKATSESVPPVKKQQASPSHANKPSNGISIAMLGISLIALAAGLVAVWTSMSSQSQIDSLTTQLETIQSNPQRSQLELIAVQKQLISIKQELAELKVTKQAPAVMNNKPAETIKPVATVATPVVITPSTPVKEVKPTFQKNTWNVIISSHNSMKKANKEQQREAIKAMQTSIVPVVVKGNTWYRIVASGFADKQQAIRFAHKLKKLGISDAWIQYNK